MTEPHVQMTYTPAKLKRLETAYATAKRDGVEQFTFDGHPYLVAYAKYLIEYLRERFGSSN